MNIGQAAKKSGVTAKMIRHYESIGLIREGKRTESGYRTYIESDLHTFRFIKRCRSLGFSLENIRQLLSLWQNSNRASADVKSLAFIHIGQLDAKIKELKEIRGLLEELVEACHGDEHPDCPILNGLVNHKPSSLSDLNPVK